MPKLPSCLLALALAGCPGVPEDDDGDSGIVETDVSDDTDLEAGELRVVVHTDAGDPVAGAMVVFHGQDGTVGPTTTTDAAGEATGTITPGGAVTVVRGSDLITVLGVGPGDEVRLGDLSPDLPIEATLEATVTPYAGADGYQVSTGCEVGGYAESAAAPIQTFFGPACLTPTGRVDVLAWTEADGLPTAYTMTLGVEPADPGPTAVSLPSPWRTDWALAALSLSSAPPGSKAFDATLVVKRDDRIFYQHTASSPVVPGGGATATPRAPRDFAQQLATVISLQFDAPDTGVAWFRRDERSLPADVVLDGAELSLPPTSATAETTSPGRARIAWSGGTVSPATRVVVTYSAALGAAVWEVLLAGDARSFELPALPDDLGHLRPTGDAPFTEVAIAGLTLVDVDPHELLTTGTALLRGAVLTVPGEREGTLTLATFEP